MIVLVGVRKVAYAARDAASRAMKLTSANLWFAIGQPLHLAAVLAWRVKVAPQALRRPELTFQVFSYQSLTAYPAGGIAAGAAFGDCSAASPGRGIVRRLKLSHAVLLN